jgi:hypothetical protein
VFDTSGEAVAEGVVGGAALQLPAGSYRVVIASEGRELSARIAGGDETVITL